MARLARVVVEGMAHHVTQSGNRRQPLAFVASLERDVGRPLARRKPGPKPNVHDQRRQILCPRISRLHRRKNDLLRVLDRREIPLHTNGSESDIRAFVTKRKISGGTVSHAGKTARDVMLGLAKTCAKQGVSFYRFLGDRFAVPGAQPVPNLADLLRATA